MIMASSKWEHHVVFDDGSVTHLIIENPVTYRSYIQELHEQINGGEGSFVLSEDNKEISFSKNIEMLTDPICFGFDARRINSKIAKDLVGMVNSGEYHRNFNEVLAVVSSMAEGLVEAYPLNIDYDAPDSEALIKMLSFHLDPDYSSPAEKLLEYMNISHDILGIGNFVILNSELYFTENELLILSGEAASMKHNILFIDHVSEYKFSNRIIIDEDNCEII